jgi:hypothetical protein
VRRSRPSALERSPLASPRKLTRAKHIGPWLSEDYTTFRDLCNEALRLEPPKPGDLLSGWREPSTFSAVADAENALHQHPVYQWLTKNVPSAIADDGDLFFERLRRLQTIVHNLPRAGSLTRGRPDKQRGPLLKAIARMERGLADGTLRLANMAQEEMFKHLLSVARTPLRGAQRKPKPHAYPMLWRLAQELCEQIGKVDVSILLEVSTALGIGCDERTARRYATDAQRENKAADR